MLSCPKCEEDLEESSIQCIYCGYYLDKNRKLKVSGLTGIFHRFISKILLSDFANKKTMGQRDICGKCGITREERLRRWNAPAPPGVIKLGTGREAFLYCEHCQKGICGACSIDLGWTAGCPLCKTELVYMDGGRQ
jgi:uncharacterized protein YbaR (Trm112 family)